MWPVGRRAMATLFAEIFSCPDGEHCFIRQCAPTGNFSVVAKENLHPVTA